jgi:23S rRNA pseudouridine1911/1915/1917 synthase
MEEIKDELDGTEDQGEDLFDQVTYKADPKQSPLRIDKFLFDRMEGVSRNRIQNAIFTGAVLVNGKEIKPSFKIMPGNLVTVVIPKSTNDGTVVPENIPLDIVYEDEDVLIINKKPGIAMHPGIGMHSGTLVNGLAYYLQNSALPVMEGNTPDRPGLVHRIDKDTSGLVLTAKTDFAMTHLAKQFFDHTIHRRYWALIWGQPEELEGTITGNIGRHPRNRLQMFVFEDGSEGKHAVTHYKVLEPMYYVSLVECNLETGRTHQIRAHMKSKGHPLFNDERYGGNDIVKGTVFTKYRQFVMNTFKILPRQALHARELGFIHPRTGKEMFFTAELPDDFQNALDKWRDYLTHRKEMME